MSDYIGNLINQLVQAAKAQGLSQARLAEKAGMTPVGLSKAKQRGDIRVSSLQALADVLGWELCLQPRRAPEQIRQAIKSGTLFQTATGANEANKTEKGQ